MRKGNGFTLVEIIVSIAIGSIVLLIAGGIILSSSNFLMTTTDMDIDKRAVDSIVDFVRGEIEYSTDVRFVQHGDELAPNYTEDSDWHYFYIKDNELYRDGAKVFAKSFTNNKSLSISMKGNGTSTSNHRLDIKYALLDNKNEISYSSRDTVMLLNLSVSQEILNQGIYSADFKDLSDNGYWLFYTKKAKDLASIPEEKNEYTGTVADRLINCINTTNNRGLYDINHVYNPGDYMYYNGYWWYKGNNQSISDNRPPEDKASGWTKLTPEFQSDSYYMKDDIILFNNQYYIYTVTWFNVGSSECIPGKANSLWKKVDNIDSVKHDYKNNYDENKNEKVVTILQMAKKDNPNIDFTDVTRKGFEQWKKEKNYVVGDYVVKISSDYSYLYKKIFPTTYNIEPGTMAESGWLLIENDYSSTSAYDVTHMPIVKQGGMTYGTSVFVYAKPKYQFVSNSSSDEIKKILSYDFYITINAPLSTYCEYNYYTKEAFWDTIGG